MEPIKIFTIFLFVLTYFFIIRNYDKKARVVWISVLILISTTILSPGEAWISINWNVILLYFGMLFVSEVFLYSKMPDYLASLFASKTKSTTIAMLVICAFTSFLSILLENVACVLLVAPIALSIAKKLKMRPVPLFVGMAISSNLQGVGTLIGDPPSMLLGGFMNLTFNDFFILNAKPSIFFAVQVGAIVSLFVLYFFFKKFNAKMPKIKRDNYTSIVPTLLVIALVVALIFSSSLGGTEGEGGGTNIAGILCVVFGMLCYAWYMWRTKDYKVGKYIKKLDWQTGVFLIGIFVLVQSLSSTGVVGDITNSISALGGDNPFLTFQIVVWVSVLMSAFIDNVPFVVLMLPVTASLTQSLGTNPYLLPFGLLLGASVGGNVTPVGAAANIVSMGIMKNHGFKPTFGEFVKIGLPFTIAATLASTTFIWIIFG